MTGKYRAYAEYKDSGSQWLGDIPSKWIIFDGKRVFKNRRELALDVDEQLAASQKYGVVPQSLMMKLNDSKVMLALKGTSSFRHVEKNDFVISLRSFEGGIEHSNYGGCVSPAYTVLNATKNIAPRFYRYLFKSNPFIAALQSTTDSLRDGKSITYEQFGAIPLVLPTVDEQEKIANFLDHETAKIDTLIEKQQRLIKLLKEKRQAVISHAVTKGLNPNAPMRDSGVEWLGEVPAHWDVVPLKRAIELQRGHDLPSDSRTEGEYPVVSSGGSISTHNEYRAKGPGIVTGRYGTIGEFYLIESDYWPLNTSLYSVNTHGNDVKYLWYMLHNIKHLFVLNSLKSAVPGVDRNDLHPERIAIPNDNHEQKSIVEFLDEKLEQLSNVEQKANKMIGLMLERRTALISAAVTGKIDVRDWQAPEQSQVNKEAAA